MTAEASADSPSETPAAEAVTEKIAERSERFAKVRLADDGDSQSVFVMFWTMFCACVRECALLLFHALKPRVWVTGGPMDSGSETL
jgi:hypothetical protein